MKKKIQTGLIWLFAVSLWADGEYSAHKTFKLTRETKIIAITMFSWNHLLTTSQIKSRTKVQIKD